MTFAPLENRGVFISKRSALVLVFILSTVIFDFKDKHILYEIVIRIDQF
jgi:hypothetical protein